MLNPIAGGCLATRSPANGSLAATGAADQVRPSAWQSGAAARRQCHDGTRRGGALGGPFPTSSSTRRQAARARPASHGRNLSQAIDALTVIFEHAHEPLSPVDPAPAFVPGGLGGLCPLDQERKR